MNMKKKPLCSLSEQNPTGCKTPSFLDKAIQKLKSISSLIRKHIPRHSQSMKNRMFYNNPFAMSKYHKKVTEEEIAYLENMLEEYKKSLKEHAE